MNPIRKFVFLFLLLSATFGFSQQKLSDQTTISVLTCGLGNEMYSLFGHTAIRIYDPAQNLDMVYNYGAFDFETPNFVMRFSKGDLQYFVTSDTFSDFLVAYDYEQRSVWEQQIAMTSDQQQRLYDELNATMNSDRKFYTYKFIDRNCTTMVVDLLNRIYGVNVITKIDSEQQTFREVLYPYFDNHFYEQLGTSIIFGKKVDDLAQHIFLPNELLESIDKSTFHDKPLLIQGKTWLKFDVPAAEGIWWNNWISYLLVLILIIIANSRIVTSVYLFVVSAIGLFFSIAGLYSFHEELAWNYNVLLFNPILFVAVYSILRRNLKLTQLIAKIYIFGLLIYIGIMLNKIHLLIVTPLIVTNAFLLGRYILLYRKSKVR